MSENIENFVVAPQEVNGREDVTNEANHNHESNPQKDYSLTLDKANKIEEKLTEALLGVRETNEKMKNLRESMGLPSISDSGEETSGENYVKSLEKQKEDVEKEIVYQEQEMLGVPDGEGANHQSVEKQMRIFAEQNIEGLEKKAREKYVLEFIKSSVEDITKSFESFLEDSQNADAARTLIQQKIRFEVGNRAKDFIENGGEPNFGFEAEITGAEFDAPGKGNVMYVTEFNLQFEGVGTTSNESAYAPTEELVDIDIRQKMKEVEEEGRLEETRKETVS